MVSKAIEWKHFDTYQSATAIASTTGVVFGGFCLPPRGTGENQRVGDVVRLSSFTVEGSMICSDATNIMRVIVFRWRPDNSIDSPSWTKILQDTTNLPFFSPINEASLQQSKIHVLLDKSYTMVLNTASGLKRFKWRFYGKRLGKKKLAFNTNAITGMDNIYMFMISDSLAVSHPAVQFQTRVVFTDA